MTTKLADQLFETQINLMVIEEKVDNEILIILNDPEMNLIDDITYDYYDKSVEIEVEEKHRIRWNEEHVKEIKKLGFQIVWWRCTDDS